MLTGECEARLPKSLPEFTFTVFHDRPSTIEICGDRGKQVVTLTREAGLNCKCFALCDCDFTLFDLQHYHASPLGSRSGANIAPLRHALPHGSLQPAHAMLQCCNAARAQPHFHKTALKEEGKSQV